MGRANLRMEPLARVQIVVNPVKSCCLEAFGLPIYEHEGYEADDLLGTLAAQATEEGVETYLVSLDSDIAQLVRPGVRLWMYRPYQRDSVVYETAEQVKGKYGVLPEQVPDLKALKGDVSDNIPGVPGVGDKTAARLIEQFGTVENLYDHVDEVTPPKLQQALREHQDQVRQGKHLATIVSEAPVKLDLDAAELATHFDRDRRTRRDILRFRDFEHLAHGVYLLHAAGYAFTVWRRSGRRVRVSRSARSPHNATQGPSPCPSLPILPACGR